MEDYKKKYLEYKIKYIELKKSMENKTHSGGAPLGEDTLRKLGMLLTKLRITPEVRAILTRYNNMINYDNHKFTRNDLEDVTNFINEMYEEALLV